MGILLYFIPGVVTNPITGRILSKSAPDGQSALEDHYENLEKCGYYDTGFVLVLEIRDDGKAGEFHIIYNSTSIGPFDEPESHQVDKASKRSKFCGNQFTMAKVLRQNRFTLLKGEKDGSKDELIDIKKISATTLEFVESGIRVKGQKIDALVAPFSRS